MKPEQVIKDAIQSQVDCMEASATEQADTKAHQNCSRQ